MKNVDEQIEKLLSTKGDYITQAVAFNKKCPRQMELLRFALSDSASFSGLVKEMLALRKEGIQPVASPIQSPPPIKRTVKDVGNFL